MRRAHRQKTSFSAANDGSMLSSAMAAEVHHGIALEELTHFGGGEGRAEITTVTLYLRWTWRQNNSAIFIGRSADICRPSTIPDVIIYF